MMEDTAYLPEVIVNRMESDEVVFWTLKKNKKKKKL